MQAMAGGHAAAGTNVHDTPDGHQSRAAQGEHGHVTPLFSHARARALGRAPAGDGSRCADVCTILGT
jgi:hypothetical protein